MSDRTNNFSLPLIYQNQSQKELLINESLTIIDNILAKGAISITSTPPALPNNGDLYIVGVSATGDWTGKDDMIAYYVTEWGWQFYQPQEGYTIRVIADEKLYSYTATGWELTLQSFDDLTKLGVNATADTTNRLSVSSPAILFNHETDDIQVKVNKDAAGDNASFLFQTGFSGRAEIGLTGDDDFHFKVSPDGSTWYDAITIDKDTGNVSLTGGGGGGGGGSWGSITGTLSSQTDLQTALDGKVDENSAITGATKTKITYDAKGLVTAGADATTADIADSTNKRYVTDAQLTVLGNTSGTNTGDQTITLTGDVTGSGAGSFAATIANNAVSDAKLRQSAGLSLIGRSANSTGNVADIVAANDGEVMRRSGTSVGFGAVDLDNANAVTGTLAVANGGTNSASAIEAARNLNGCYVLAQSAVAASVSATTSEETLATINIPANAMGANGFIEIITFWTNTNSANNKTLRVKLDGTTFRAVTVTTGATINMYAGIANRNATNSQVGFFSQTISTLFGTSSVNALVTGTVDTTASKDITITGQKASSGETLTLEGYRVFLYPKG